MTALQPLHAVVGCVLFPVYCEDIPQFYSCTSVLESIACIFNISKDEVLAIAQSLRGRMDELVYGTVHSLSRHLFVSADSICPNLGSYDRFLSSRKEDLQKDLLRYKDAIQLPFVGKIRLTAATIASTYVTNKNVRMYFSVQESGCTAAPGGSHSKETEKSKNVSKCKDLANLAGYMPLDFEVKSSSSVFVVSIVEKRSFGRKPVELVHHTFACHDFTGPSSVWGREVFTFANEHFSIELQYTFRDFSALSPSNQRPAAPYLADVDPCTFCDVFLNSVFSNDPNRLSLVESVRNAGDEEDSDDEGARLLSPMVRWVFNELRSRYKITHAHIAIVFFSQFARSSSLCMRYPHDMLSYVYKASRSCTGTSGGTEVVTKEDMKMFQESSTQLTEKAETVLSNFKSYPVTTLHPFIVAYSHLLFMDYESEPFAGAISEFIRRGIESHYASLKEEALSEGVTAAAYVSFCRSLLSALEKDVEVYAIDAFPSSIGYLSLVAHAVYPLLKNDVSTFLVGSVNAHAQFDSAIFQFSHAYSDLVQFWSRNLPTSMCEFGDDGFDISHLLLPHMDLWLEETRKNLRQWVTNAVVLDKWAPVGDENRYSSSVVDAFRLCETVLSVWQAAKVDAFRAKVANIVSQAISGFVDLIRTKVFSSSEDLKQSSSLRSMSFFSLHRDENEEESSSSGGGDGNHEEELVADGERDKCVVVQLNSVWKVLDLLPSIAERCAPGYDHEVDNLCVHDGDDDNDDTGQTRARATFLQTEKQARHAYYAIIALLCDRVRCSIRSKVWQIAEKPDDTKITIDVRCESLFRTLERALSTGADLMCPTVFRDFLRAMYAACLSVIEDTVAADDPELRLPGVTVRQIKLFQAAVGQVCEFYGSDSETMTRSILDKHSKIAAETLDLAILNSATLMDLFFKYSESSDDDIEKASKILNILDSRKENDKEVKAFLDGASEKIDVRVQKRFGLPKSEQCYGRYICECADVGKGKLYLTTRYLCFKPSDSNNPSASQLVMSLSSVVNLDLGDEGLDICLADQSHYFFTGFANGKLQRAFDDIFVRSQAVGCKLRRESDAAVSISPQAIEKLRSRFSLTADQDLFQTFGCLLRLAIPSTMYVFSSYLCFDSSVPLVGKQFVIPMQDIMEIRKVLLRAVEVRTMDGTEILVTGLMNRNVAFRAISVRGSVLKLPWRVSTDGSRLFHDDNVHRDANAIIAENQVVRDDEILRKAACVAIDEQLVRSSFGVPAEEKFFGQYRCVSKGDQGFLYIFRQHLCFDSILFSHGASRVVIPMADIRMVTKKKNEEGVVGKGIVVLDKNRFEHKFSSFSTRGECYRSIKIVAADAGAVFLDKIDDDDATDSKYSEMMQRLGLSKEEEVLVEFHAFSSRYLKGTLYICSTCIVFDPLFMKRHAFVERYMDLRYMRKPPVMRLSLEFTRFDGTKFSIRGLKRRNDVFAAILRRSELLGLNLESSAPSQELVQKRWQKQCAMVIRKFGLPQDEQLLFEFHCMRRLSAGFLWVTTSFVCFDASILPGRADTMVAIPVLDIDEVRPSRQMLLFPNAISIHTREGRVYDFHSFLCRQDALSAITERSRDVLRLYQPDRTSGKA